MFCSEFVESILELDYKGVSIVLWIPIIPAWGHTPWWHGLWGLNKFLVHLYVYKHFDNHIRLHRGKWIVSLDWANWLIGTVIA